MSKNRKKRKISDAKKNGPFLKFNFFILVIIFVLSFTGCFVLYMVSANLDKDFLNSESKTSSKETSSVISENEDSTSDLNSIVSSENIISNPVAECSPADESYFDKSMFIADSIILGSEASRLKNVIGSQTLSAASINTIKIESPNGSNTAEELIKASQPENVYILLSNNISDISTATGSLETFITNILLSLPDSDVYIMQVPPVINDSSVTNEQINNYNSALLNLANKKSV